MATELLPCPFCGEPAESDLNRHFINYKGHPDSAVAIYCTACEADMTLCYGDFRDDTPEYLLSIIGERWNKRAGLDELHQQDRLKTREINTLVPENRNLLAALRNVVDVWTSQSGRVFESMGSENPRAHSIHKAIRQAAALLPLPNSVPCRHVYQEDSTVCTICGT